MKKNKFCVQKHNKSLFSKSGEGANAPTCPPPNDVPVLKLTWQTCSENGDATNKLGGLPQGLYSVY